MPNHNVSAYDNPVYDIEQVERVSGLYTDVPKSETIITQPYDEDGYMDVIPPPSENSSENFPSPFNSPEIINSITNEESEL